MTKNKGYSRSSDGINSCTHLNFKKCFSILHITWWATCCWRSSSKSQGFGLAAYRHLQHWQWEERECLRRCRGESTVGSLSLGWWVYNSTEKCWKWRNIRTRYFLTHRLCHKGSISNAWNGGKGMSDEIQWWKGKWIVLNQDVKLGHRENQIENKNRKES